MKSHQYRIVLFMSLLLIGALTMSAFSKEKTKVQNSNKRIDHFYAYLGNSNSYSDLSDTTKWLEVGSPESMECGGSSIVCTVSDSRSPVAFKTYLKSTAFTGSGDLNIENFKD